MYNQQSCLLNLSKNEKLNIIQSDVRNYNLLKEEVKKNDAIITSDNYLALQHVIESRTCNWN